MTRVAVFASHPIQYQAPWYRALARRPELDPVVYFARIPTPEQQGVGFGVPFSWDVPVLEGYEWKTLEEPRLGRPETGFFGVRSRKVGRVLDRDRPEVVLITGWQAAALVQGLVAARRRGVPTVLRAESNGRKPRPAWVRAMHRGILCQFDAFLAIGRANRAFYLEKGVGSERVFPAPYFVDNEFFVEASARLEAERDAIRTECGIPSEAVCFAFVGKLIQKKRVMDLLRAFERARGATRRPLRLLVVGEGAQMGRARAFVEAHGNGVEFTGFLNQTEIPRAYVAADCLVLPSDYDETWGLVVNEAMACARPAIVSDRVGCAPDLVHEDVTGWTFPFGDEEALARVLQRAADDPGALRSMGDRARDLVREYSVEAAVEGTVEALRYAVGDRAEAAARS